MKDGLLAFLRELDADWTTKAGGFFLKKKGLMIYPFEIEGCSFADLERAASLRSRDIRVICLWEDMWLQKNALVRMWLAGEVQGRRRVFARHCTVKALKKEEADAFFEAAHLLGAAQAKYRYGLNCRGQLIAAAAFSSMRRIEREERLFRSAEWVRYASLPSVAVIGGMGKVLSAFVAEHHPDDVMSYAGKDWSEGAVYGKLGFKAVGEIPAQTFWLDPDTMQRYPAKRHAVPQPHWKQVYGMGSVKYLLVC